MKRYIIITIVCGVTLFVAGFAAGYLAAGRQLAAAEPTAEAVAADLAYGEMMPMRDVTGSDIEGLPRYPGAVRVEYRNVIVGELEETEVEYVVTADLDSVHDFYRHVFDDESWTVADLGIYQGEWTFFVVSGEREAVLELEVRQSLVEIEIELSEPVAP